jgi:L-ascorbate metabolism protein UlaG (beta-lactamase superfamily)
MRVGIMAKTGLYWLGHSSFRIENENMVLFIDPFQVSDEPKADIILITHTHQDHLDMASLEKIIKPETIMVCTPDAHSKIMKLNPSKIIIVRPNQDIEIGTIKIRTYPAYNLDKPYHPKEEGWVGYKIMLDDISIFHSGDLDAIPEICTMKADVVLLPVSGVYVMNHKEAADITRAMTFKLAVPMHYGSIVGSEDDAIAFQKLVGEKSKVPKKGANLTESL